MELLTDSFSNFWRSEDIEKALKKISCDRVNSTFVPFWENAIEKLELFCNNYPTFIPFQSPARLAQSYARVDRYVHFSGSIFVYEIH